jgi:hypothetical protein
MVSIGGLRAFEPEARSIAGASHNAMVDHPHAVWNWLNEVGHG